MPQESLDFEEASKRCGQLVDHGRLFEPMSKLQNNVVHSLIKEVYGVENGKNYWIGISDRELEGQFVFLSSGAPLAFQYWQHNEPNGGVPMKIAWVTFATIANWDAWMILVAKEILNLFVISLCYYNANYLKFPIFVHQVDFEKTCFLSIEKSL